MQKTAWHKPARAHGTIFDGFRHPWQGSTNDGTQTCLRARKRASRRPARNPRMFTVTANERTSKMRAIQPLGSLPWPRDGAHGRNREHAWERHSAAMGGGAAAAVTVETAAAMTAVLMSAVSPAHRERTQVSVHCVRRWLFEPRYARVGRHGQAHLGSHRRSCRSGRSSEPAGEGGAHPRDEQGRSLSSARPPGSAVVSPHSPRWKSHRLRAHTRS